MAANDSKMSAKWSDCRPIFAVIGAAMLLSLLASIYAHAGIFDNVFWPAEKGYWVKSKTRSVQEATIIVELKEGIIDFACTGKPAQKDIKTNGCFIEGVVFLRKGMSPDKRACVLGHEATNKFSHANAYEHTDSEINSWIDCGDGTMMKDDDS
ncbi:MAG: hypothetical protein NUV60_03310 [Patescibacteria group bacterium]|nr:hypothetical protein [Patescibacteria group bacterium]